MPRLEIWRLGFEVRSPPIIHVMSVVSQHHLPKINIISRAFGRKSPQVECKIARDSSLREKVDTSNVHQQHVFLHCNLDLRTP
jgi:hypothetical protein